MKRPQKLLPDQELLIEFLKYEPDTGKLFWKPRAEHHFNVKHQQTRWNKLYANKPAFCILDSVGYLRGNLFNKVYATHRIVWKYVYGVDPNVIDHIDGNKQNNAITNLRDVDTSINGRNRCMNSANTTGCMGVYHYPAKKGYQVSIKDNNKFIYIGWFKNYDEAVAARKEAEIKYNYHPNHGRAA